MYIGKSGQSWAQFLTEVPDMAKTSEAALLQVCSLKLKPPRILVLFTGAPLESG